MIDILGTEQKTNCSSSAFTATVCPQLCAENVDHAFTTGLWGPGTSHGFGVHRAHLVIPFQTVITFRITTAGTGYVMTGHLFAGPAHDVVGPTLRLLCADWV